MQANEFVKKFGLKLAQRDVAALKSGFIKREDFLEHYGFDILDDLKRLVESHKLVEKCGGIESLKSWLNYEKRMVDLSVYFHCNKPPVLLNIDIAEKAIADVESCQ